MGLQKADVDGADVARELSAIISEVTESGRTLATPYHVSSSRHGGRHFAKRNYVDALGGDRFSVEQKGKSNRRRQRKAENTCAAAEKDGNTSVATAETARGVS